MRRINKLQSMVNDANERRIRELCEWMAAHCDRPLGWDALTAQSGFSHRDLMTLFEIYVKTSPMTYLRRCREDRRMTSPAKGPGSLFSPQVPAEPKDPGSDGL